MPQTNLSADAYNRMVTFSWRGNDSYVFRREHDGWRGWSEVCGETIPMVKPQRGSVFAGWDEALAIWSCDPLDLVYGRIMISDDDCIDVPEEIEQLLFVSFLPDGQVLFENRPPDVWSLDAHRLIWAEQVGDSLRVTRDLDLPGILLTWDAPWDNFPGDRKPFAIDADGVIWVTGIDPRGLFRIAEEVTHIPFSAQDHFGSFVRIDRDGNKVLILEPYDKRLHIYVDGGPASQRIVLFAYLDGDGEQELVVEAEVVNCALAAAWLNAYFVAEYNGQFYYAPHWSADPSSLLPHWVKAGSGSRQSGEVLRIPISELPSGHYKFYGGIAFRDRPMNELIGSPSEKISVAEIDIP